MANEPTTIDITNLLIGKDEKPFNLQAIDVAEGARLLAALPEAAQLRARAKAERLQNVKTVLVEELPVELREPGALEAFLKTMTKGGGKIPGDASDAFKAVYRRLQGDAPEMQPLKSILSNFDLFLAANKGVGFLTDVTEEYVDNLLRAPRKIGQLWVGAHENAGSLAAKPAPEQLLAAAAVFEAVKEGAIRTPGAPVTEAATQNPGFFDKLFARGSHIFDIVANSGFGKSLRAFGIALSDAIGGNGFNFSKALAEVNAAIAANPPKSFETLLAEQMSAKVDVQTEKPVKVALENITEVAGLPTTSIFSLMQHGGYYATFDGKIESMTKGGVIKPLTLNDKPLTETQLTKAREGEVAGSIGTHGKGVEYTAKAAAAVTAAAAAETIVRRHQIAPAVDVATDYAKAKATHEALQKHLDEVSVKKAKGKTIVSADDYAKLQKQVATAQEKMAASAAKLESLGVTPATLVNEKGEALTKAERAANVAEQRIAAMKESEKLGSRVAGVLEQYAMAPRAWYNLANPFRLVGSAIGTTFDVVGTKAVNILGAGAGKVVDLYKGTKSMVSDAADAVKTVAGIKPSVTAEAAAAAAEAASAAPKAAAMASEAVEKAGLLSRAKEAMMAGKNLVTAHGGAALAKVGKFVAPALGFVRKLPVVGAVGAAGAVAFTSGAHAETFDGHTLNMREQLIKDYVTGRIPENKYLAYKSLQDGYAVTGLGGFLTSELGQGLVSELDKTSMTRYLPSTLVDMGLEKLGREIPAGGIADVQPQTAAERQARLDEVRGEGRDTGLLAGIVERAKTMPAIRMFFAAQELNKVGIHWDILQKSIDAVPLLPAVEPATDRALNGLHAAAVDATLRAQEAAKSASQKLAFAGASRATNTTLGAVHDVSPDAGASLAGVHAKLDQPNRPAV